jgi:AraC-like DNA-binding protein
MQQRRVRLVRHDEGGMRFEVAFAAPGPAVAAYAREYVGWIDHSTRAAQRRELPSGNVPLIVNFGGRVRERKAGASAWCELGSFTAGLHDTYTIVESAGTSEGLQVNFTALGARLFYNRPLAELAHRTVDIVDVLERDGGRLIDQLHDAGTWEARFDLLDREIASRAAAARRPAREVVWTWQRLRATRGQARIADLAREVGWSRRHLAVQFGHEIGLTPKAFARTLRFSSAVRILTSPDGASLADVAQACGYFDQAHFTHDFRAFAGTTPMALVESRYPADTGYRA